MVIIVVVVVVAAAALSSSSSSSSSRSSSSSSSSISRSSRANRIRLPRKDGILLLWRHCRVACFIAVSVPSASKSAAHASEFAVQEETAVEV